MNATKQISLRHFIMIPFEDPKFIESYNNFCDTLKSYSPKNFDDDLLQKPSKLHISALIFDLQNNQEKITKVCTIMKEIQEEIKNFSKGELTYKFGGYGAFDSFKEARVVYGKMVEDESFGKLEQIIDLVIKKLLKEGIILESQLNELHVVKSGSDVDPFYKIEMHLTLLNATFLNKVLKKKNKKTIKSFDATYINDCIQSLKLADCPLKKIDFCVLREDKSIGKYELVQSFDLV